MSDAYVDEYKDAIETLNGYVHSLERGKCIVRTNMTEDCNVNVKTSPKVNFPPKSQVDIDTIPVLVVMVGPPARGKSATFKKLQRVFRGISMINAGDVRRNFEHTMKKNVDKKRMLNVIMSYCEDPMDDDVRDEMELWLLDEAVTAIPGKIFEKFRKLNEKFAEICIGKAIDSLEEGNHVFFDATNTDIARRELLIRKFTEVVRLNPERRLLFIENICINTHQLLTNFKSKLTDSGDYKARVISACGHHVELSPYHSKSNSNAKANVNNNNNNNNNAYANANANAFQVNNNALYKNAANKRIEEQVGNLGLFQIPSYVVGKDEGHTCKKEVITALKDILRCDFGYMQKYVAMHMQGAKNEPSTIETIARINAQLPIPSIAYLQLVLRICIANNVEEYIQPGIKGLQNSNVYLKFLRVLVKELASDINAKTSMNSIAPSSYDASGRIKFTYNDISHLFQIKQSNSQATTPNYGSQATTPNYGSQATTPSEAPSSNAQNSTKNIKLWSINKGVWRRRPQARDMGA